MHCSCPRARIPAATRAHVPARRDSEFGATFAPSDSMLRWFGMLGALLIVVTTNACSAESSEDVASGTDGEAALTVENGAEYVVEVTPTTITLKKSVKGVALRFTKEDFENK